MLFLKGKLGITYLKTEKEVRWVPTNLCGWVYLIRYYLGYLILPECYREYITFLNGKIGKQLIEDDLNGRRGLKLVK